MWEFYSSLPRDRANSKKQKKSSFEELINNKRKEIRRRKVEKERLLDLYQKSIIELDEIEERLKSTKSKIEKLEKECIVIEQEAQTELKQLNLVEQFENFKEKLNMNLANLEFEDKQKLIRLLVEEICVDMQKGQILLRHIIPVEKSLPLCWGSFSASSVLSLCGL